MENKILTEPQERDYRSVILATIRSGLSGDALKEELEKYHGNDIASVIDELTPEESDMLLESIGTEAMSEIVSYMEDAGEYLSELDVSDVADIIEQMDADDAVEVLDDLDEEIRTEVLEQIDDEEVKEDIELIDSYDEDEFGSMMSTNFIAVQRGASVKTATKTLISEAAENDNIYTVFVTDGDGFYGAIDLKDLIVARSSTELESLICTTFPYVYDNESISENIERLRGYSEDLIPVISHQNMSILGVITAQDITDIVDKELGDDYAKLAALSSEQKEDETLLGSIKKRVPWLIALLFMGLAVSAVVGLFENVVDSLPMIVAFQSLILGMAGNVGTQSLAVTVRALGGSEETKFKEQFMIIVKETRVALLNGIFLGIIAFVIVGGYLLILGELSVPFALTAAVCVGLAMCFAMMISGFTGAAIPIILYRLGVDPAVASGPLITTVNDLVAVISYYGLAWLLLLNLI